ncbi:hypothetical protein AMTRI_Chr05g68180 [Amborella trichopoda]
MVRGGFVEVGDSWKICIELGKSIAKRARQTIISSFCRPIDDMFSLSDWARRGWGLSDLPEVFLLGKGRVAFILKSDGDVAMACKERFYRSPMAHPSFIQKAPSWVCLWGVPLHVWDIDVFKKIVSSFGEFCGIDSKMLKGSNVAIVRVKINRFVGIPCPRDITLQVGLDLFRIDVCLEGVHPEVELPKSSNGVKKGTYHIRTGPEDGWVEVKLRRGKMAFHSQVGGIIRCADIGYERSQYSHQNFQRQMKKLKIRNVWVPVRRLLSASVEKQSNGLVNEPMKGIVMGSGLTLLYVERKGSPKKMMLKGGSPKTHEDFEGVPVGQRIGGKTAAIAEFGRQRLFAGNNGRGEE